jgi:hypothetical protein
LFEDGDARPSFSRTIPRALEQSLFIMITRNESARVAISVGFCASLLSCLPEIFPHFQVGWAVKISLGHLLGRPMKMHKCGTNLDYHDTAGMFTKARRPIRESRKCEEDDKTFVSLVGRLEDCTGAADGAEADGREHRGKSVTREQTQTPVELQ